MTISKQTVVFILSEVRSGSTWLSYVLGSHREAVHLGEYYRPFTMPNHIACRLCQAKGKKQCDYLHGIQDVEISQAFDFAFKRFNKNWLIDCSKQLDWLNIFINSQNYNIKIIHLHRDPRAWFASQKRRNSNIDVHLSLSSWIDTNINITNKVKELNIKFITPFYDELCLRPDLYFSDYLCPFIGLPFEKSALCYWEKEHHGLGGNGAAFNNLSRFESAQLNTGDDKYYQEMNQKIFFDSRWKTELTNREIQIIETNHQVNGYLNQLGKSFEHFNLLFRS